MFKSKFCRPTEEVNLPDFPDDDNTVTTTITRSRRVSFGTNLVKEFMVGSAVSAKCVSEYEQAFSSSDSSNPNSSHSAVESGILNQNSFVLEDLKKSFHEFSPAGELEEMESCQSAKRPKFGRTICFSSDSPTADMEFTEGCLTLAKSILDKKNKEMTVIIQAKSKDCADEKGKKEDEAKYPDEVLFENSMSQSLKFKDSKREEKKFDGNKTKLYNTFDDDMSLTRFSSVLREKNSNVEGSHCNVSLDRSNLENKLPLEMIMEHLDKDNSDLESDLFNPDRSLSDFLKEKKNASVNSPDNLSLNESMDISKEEFQRSFFKEPSSCEPKANETRTKEFFEEKVNRDWLRESEDVVSPTAGSRKEVRANEPVEDSFLETITKHATTATATATQKTVETNKTYVHELEMDETLLNEVDMSKDSESPENVGDSVKFDKSMVNVCSEIKRLDPNFDQNVKILETASETVVFERTSVVVDEKIENGRFLETTHVVLNELTRTVENLYEVPRVESPHLMCDRRTETIEGKNGTGFLEKTNLVEEYRSETADKANDKEVTNLVSEEMSFSDKSENDPRMEVVAENEVEANLVGKSEELSKSCESQESPTLSKYDGERGTDNVTLSMSMTKVVPNNINLLNFSVESQTEQECFRLKEGVEVESKADASEKESSMCLEFDRKEDSMALVGVEGTSSENVSAFEKEGSEVSQNTVSNSSIKEQEDEFDCVDMSMTKGFQNEAKEVVEETETNEMAKQGLGNLLVEESNTENGAEAKVCDNKSTTKDDCLEEFEANAENRFSKCVEDSQSSRVTDDLLRYVSDDGTKENDFVSGVCAKSSIENREANQSRNECVQENGENERLEEGEPMFCVENEISLVGNGVVEGSGGVENEESQMNDCSVSGVFCKTTQKDKLSESALSRDENFVEKILSSSRTSESAENSTTGHRVEMEERFDENVEVTVDSFLEKDFEGIPMDLDDVEEEEGRDEMGKNEGNIFSTEPPLEKALEVEYEESVESTFIEKSVVRENEEHSYNDDMSKSMEVLEEEEDISNGGEVPFVDSKVMEDLKNQAKEPNCLWTLKGFKYSKKKTGEWYFNFKLLESTATVTFRLKVSGENTLGSCSSVVASALTLDEDTALRRNEYKPTLEFGFEHLKKYLSSDHKMLETILDVAYFLDQLNSYAIKLNSHLQQVYCVLTQYPGSRLKGSILTFRLFSFPILFSTDISLNLEDLYKLSKSSLSFKHEIGTFDEKIVGDIFEKCLKHENFLCEFVVRTNKHVIEIEREMGAVTKRNHIKLLPRELLV